MSSNPTLRDLFAPKNGANTGRDVAIPLPRVPSYLTGVIGELEWRSICEKVLDLLDVSLIDVLVGAWAKHREIMKQLRASATDPTRTLLVHLGRHSITSNHRPSIEVRLEGHVVADVAFPVEVEFELSALVLILRGGTVREIRTGEIKGKGTVKLEHAVIMKRELAPIRLPGTIVLNEDTPVSLPLRQVVEQSAGPSRAEVWDEAPTLHFE
jgi:hypothetical protein